MVDEGQPVETPGNHAHQGNVILQAFCSLQQAVLDATTRFDDFMENFDLPTTAIPLERLHRN